MARQHEVSDLLALVQFQNLAHREEIAERFRHFFVVDAHEPVVHPEIDEAFAGGRLGLRNFVFVMGKLQILPAAVDVEMIAQAAGRHRGALDMPARPSIPPGRRPGRFTGLGRLPQHEIQRIVL